MIEVDITNRPECDILSLSPGKTSQTGRTYLRSLSYFRSLVQFQIESVSQVDAGETGHSAEVWQKIFVTDLPINILGKYENSVA